VPWSEWGVLVWLTLTPGPRRGPGPALEGVAEAGGFAEAELFGDGVDRQLLAVEQQLGALEPQPVKQLLVAAAGTLQVPTQGAGGAVHLIANCSSVGGASSCCSSCALS